MIRLPRSFLGPCLAAVAALVVVAGCVPAQAESAPSRVAASRVVPSTVVPSTQRTASAPGMPGTDPGSAAVPRRASSAVRTQPGRTPAATPATVLPGAAVTTLSTLAVKGRAPRTGYERAAFGPAWADVDRNGCDTRNDILRRDLTGFTLKAGTRGCLVLRGTLHDPYTGRTIAFVRGPGTSTAVQIDHVVALSDAWQKGAGQWTAAVRAAFANDPLNLLAVDGPTNQRKSDGDAATWLPPAKATRCGYVARQIAVKKRYGLWVTAAERDAMLQVLRGCPGQGLPTSAPVALGGGTQERSAAPARTASPPAPTTGGSTRTDPRFDTCRAANAAGYGPYRRGLDVEYDWYRDRDHDGLVCER
ncbi:GmrSD restriction endonuclease domain-containing protein [Pedococcus sp. 5OH_020]|uniref:GmrSD restriction endonuclease domain-containing protein n=1 Tax=Pedococcus sp. 5OH_020 TaxID=2989814 RepID=UPI0022E9BC39|nr:DUF1524 domain-containing protein [Pedococcus sp. 5OH_020]